MHLLYSYNIFAKYYYCFYFKDKFLFNVKMKLMKLGYIIFSL